MPGGPEALTGRARRAFRSPLRGPWLTSVLGLVLLVGLPVVTLTGFWSWSAYSPGLDGQSRPGSAAFLAPLALGYPTSPVWLYRFTQGTHVGLGLLLVPIVLAKLWSVLPRLFSWPAVRSPAHALERLTLLLLVGSILLEIVTGVLNAQLFYPWPFDFYAAHYWGAWVFVGALVAHVAVKWPALRRGLRARSLRAELRTPLAGTTPEPYDPTDEAGSLAPADPAPATISRRGALAAVGGAAALVGVVTLPQTSDPLRRYALLAPHGRSSLPLGNDFPVNKTARSRGINAAMTGPAWRLTVAGPDGAEAVLDLPTCSRCRSTPTSCRSRASRAGAPRSAGRACGCATSRPWWGCRRRRRCGRSRCRPRGRSGRPPTRPARPGTSAACWRWRSTARCCTPTTASRPA